MRIPRSTRRPPAIPLASTADIAFLLLIFFIVLARGAQESTLEWKPAVTTARLQDLGTSVLSVTIDRHATIYIDGQETPATAVRQAAAERLGDRPRGQRKVLLKVDRTVQARVFEKVMMDLADAGADLYRVLEPPQK